MLFTFQAPATVSATIADGVLSIRPARPLAASAESLVEQLEPYLTVGRKDQDGTYRFALAQPVTLHVSTQGARTVVDLVPLSFAGTPPDLPAPLSAADQARAIDPNTLPAVKVRVGEYANFTRLVFDWPSEVRYGATPAEGKVSLRFDSLARPDFSMITERSPPWVKEPRWRIDGRSIVVEFATDAESEVRHFRAGNRIAVDVLAPNTDAAAYSRIANVPLAPEIPQAGTFEFSLRPSGDTGAAPLALPAPATASAAVAPAADVASAVIAPPAGPPRAELTRDGLLLRFPAARNKGVAVFARGATTWIVLDDHPALDPVALLSNVSTVIEKTDTRALEGAAVLRLVLNTRLIPSVRESDLGLEVVFSGAAATPPAPVAFARQGTGGINVLAAQLPGAVHAIRLDDADSGDRILVIPARPGRAVLTAKQFLEITALPTAAGLALVPRADDVVAKVENETAIISRPSGLTLSSANGGGPAPAVQAREAPEGPTFIDFARWSQVPGQDVYSGLRSLRAAVAGAQEANANQARLRLAQYMVAHGLAPEALGEIQLIRGIDPKLESDPRLSVMRGAAEYTMARYRDARLTLSVPALDRDPHAALWRGLVHARLNDWMNARQHFLLALPVLRSYPAELQTRVQLARAETALAMGDLALANEALQQLPVVAGRDASEAEYLRARVLGARGQVNEAIAQLTSLEQSDYAPIAARALYSRVELQLASRKIKTQDAADALERLRFRWRGDDLELNTLRLLGSIYFGEKRWREGFDSLRTAALNFPNSDIARSAQDDMRNAFVALFLNGRADALHPVQALSLFYDFIELTPIGRDGDEMIRRLSDRLVAIDLLGPAEELLQHQVDQRLEGTGRSFVAAKLAAIYLLDQKPKEALNVLTDTRQTGLPEDLNTQRRMLEARALAGVKQYEAALDLIADDGSDEAEVLRADISWQGGNWALAAARSELLLGDKWQGDALLSESERLHAMRAAVGYAMAGDVTRLALFRTRFGAKMAKTEDAKAFIVVTEEPETSGFAVRELAKKLASVETLQAFMTEFRERTNPAESAEAPAVAAAN
jgi:hypothetical protein